jgi:hypothetical protein
MGSDVGYQLRSKSEPNHKHAFKTQAHVGSDVVLAECILHPLATATKSTQTDPKDKDKDKDQRVVAVRSFAFNKKFALEQTAKKAIAQQSTFLLQESATIHTANLYRYHYGIKSSCGAGYFRSGVKCIRNIIKKS